MHNTSQAPNPIQPCAVPDLQQYKIVQQVSQSHQQQPHQDSRQAYKFPVPNTPNIKFTSHQVQVQQAQMIQNYSPLTHFNSATHSVSFSLFFLCMFFFCCIFPPCFIDQTLNSFFPLVLLLNYFLLVL